MFLLRNPTRYHSCKSRKEFIVESFSSLITILAVNEESMNRSVIESKDRINMSANKKQALLRIQCH